MKEFHSIKISVFSKENEDPNKIEEGLKKLLPFDLEKEKITILKTTALSYNKKEIKIFTIIIKKQNQIKKTIKKIFEELTKKDIETLLQTRYSRTDSKFIYIRFNKKNWINKGLLFITDKGDCYHTKFKIAAYPCNEKTSKEKVKKFLQKKAEEKQNKK
jgi:RNA binding exosome subunit